MTAAWMGYALLVGVLVAGAALGLERAWRLAGWPVRWVWAAALGLTLALVVLAPVRSAPRAGGTEVVIRAAALGAEPGGAAPAAGVLRALREVRGAAAAALRGVLAQAARLSPAALDRGLARLWLAASGISLTLLLATQLRLRRARRGWPVADVSGLRVRVAPRAGPAVIGLFHPEIVVPRWLLGLAPAERELVLCHEREHARARDPLLLAAGCLLVALLPWHPAAWWMLSRLRLAVELDCDARVLRRGARPGEYGSLLIDLAGRCSGLRVGVPMLADESSHLERRLLAMTWNVPRFAVARAGILGALACLALAAACEAKLPTAGEIEQLDAAAAQRRALVLAPTPHGDAPTVFLVDGREVTEAQAQAIPAEAIARVEVARAPTPGEPTRISLTTRAAAESGTEVPAAPEAPEAPEAPDAPAAPAAPTPPTSLAFGDFNGLLLIDGVRADRSELRKLNPERILSVEILKGSAARSLPEPEAANGVIRITTKR